MVQLRRIAFLRPLDLRHHVVHEPSPHFTGTRSAGATRPEQLGHFCYFTDWVSHAADTVPKGSKNKTLVRDFPMQYMPELLYSTRTFDKVRKGFATCTLLVFTACHAICADCSRTLKKVLVDAALLELCRHCLYSTIPRFLPMSCLAKRRNAWLRI